MNVAKIRAEKSVFLSSMNVAKILAGKAVLFPMDVPKTTIQSRRVKQDVTL